MESKQKIKRFREKSRNRSLRLFNKLLELEKFLEKNEQKIEGGLAKTHDVIKLKNICKEILVNFDFERRIK